MLLDASAGGTIKIKTAGGVRELINNMSLNEYRGHTEEEATPRKKCMIDLNTQDALLVSYPNFSLANVFQNKSIFLHQMHFHEYHFHISYLYLQVSFKFLIFMHILIYFFIFYFVTSFSRKLNFITPKILTLIHFISISLPITKFITFHQLCFQ